MLNKGTYIMYFFYNNFHYVKLPISFYLLLGTFISQIPSFIITGNYIAISLVLILISLDLLFNKYFITN